MFSLEVHVTPGAKHDRVGGSHDGRLRVSVTAAADKGKANEAVRKVLAKTLGAPKSAVVLQAGATSRRKRFVIEISDQQGREIIEREMNRP